MKEIYQRTLCGAKRKRRIGKFEFHYAKDQRSLTRQA